MAPADAATPDQAGSGSGPRTRRATESAPWLPTARADPPEDQAGRGARDAEPQPERRGGPDPGDVADGEPPAGPSPSRGRARRQIPTSPDLMADSLVSRPLADRMAQAEAWEVLGVVVELRASHPQGVAGAADDVLSWLAANAPDAPVRRSRSYVSAGLTVEQIRALVQADQQVSRERATPVPRPGERAVPADAQEAAAQTAALAAALAEADALARATPPRPAPRWAIQRLWPNFEVQGLIHRSVVTTKSEAAQRAFGAVGSGIVWAVLDSGIDADHPHFRTHHNLELTGALQHRSFLPETVDADAIRDDSGHGTHVAGILAGELVAAAGSPIVAATWYHDERGDRSGVRLSLDRIAGMAPRTTLLSCKVLRDDGSGDIAALLEALEYIQDLNHGGRELNVHGINLSVGHTFDPSWFGTGLTPLCTEVDRLVRSGVLVVVAAGNTGYGYALDDDERQMRLGFDMTINDPGNAERAITVGSTSTRPHTTGVSYFSSKGPTGDGRIKPDLVAPGERVVSAGSGRLLADARRREPDALYVENSGTSMAAPHVSGVAAGFLSVHREFLGRPEEVKRILLDSATDLHRSVTFQGRGIIDAMRAIQAV